MIGNWKPGWNPLESSTRGWDPYDMRLDPNEDHDFCLPANDLSFCREPQMPRFAARKAVSLGSWWHWTAIALGVAAWLAASRALAADGADISYEAVKIQGERVGRALSIARLGIVVAAAVTLLLGRARRRGGSPALSRSQQRWALGLVAGFAVAFNYNFFFWPSLDGFHTHDAFHYYVGAKYFPELGYFDLYDCTAAALVSNRSDLYPDGLSVRNLRTLGFQKVTHALNRGAYCEDAFGEERWREFENDIDWYHSLLGSSRFTRMLIDYGFNPSPAWTLIGYPIANAIPANRSGLILATRIDLVLTLAAFGTVGWAFGLEGLAVAAIVWSASPLSRYQWVGDSFLRYVWFASMMIGICCIKRKRYFEAGAFLTLSSLLRIFPAVFVFAYAVWGLRNWIRRRTLDPGVGRFAIGGMVTAAVVLGIAPTVIGRGYEVYREFAENIVEHSKVVELNSVGLRPLLAVPTEDQVTAFQGPPGLERASRIRELRERVFDERRPWYAAMATGIVLAFWLGVRNSRDWEAAIAGCLLILGFTSASSYYMSATVPLAFLAIGRPRLTWALLLALAVFSLANIAFYHTVLEYAVDSAVLIVLGCFAMGEVAISSHGPEDEGRNT